jgi:hypothetical protein
VRVTENVSSLKPPTHMAKKQLSGVMIKLLTFAALALPGDSHVGVQYLSGVAMQIKCMLST